MRILKFTLVILISLVGILGSYVYGFRKGFDIGVYKGIDYAAGYMKQNYECHKRNKNEFL